METDAAKDTKEAEAGEEGKTQALSWEEEVDEKLKDPVVVARFTEALALDNLSLYAPHKMKYYNRYTMDRLIWEEEHGQHHRYVTFWQPDLGQENCVFSQWYRGMPFVINGRTYLTAEQYMMSEKALLFGDLEAYAKIMKEEDPAECKKLGRAVKNFNDRVWEKSFREIIFHGNMGKLQADIRIVNALLATGDAVLVEASPYDDKYGAGMTKEDLLHADGTLKVSPANWHKEGSTEQAGNHLGFVLMGIRDLFRDMMPKTDTPEEEEEEET